MRHFFPNCGNPARPRPRINPALTHNNGEKTYPTVIVLEKRKIYFHQLMSNKFATKEESKAAFQKHSMSKDVTLII